MDGLTVRDRLERASDVLGKALEVVFMAVAVVVLTCVGILVILGTYGVLHPGDDFGFGSAGGGGDIVPSATWLL